MSGAFGSLGGDFSNLSHNPAGLGMYQFSEFTYTNSFGRNIVTSDFRNIKERDWQINSQTENIGIVLSNPKSDLNVKGLILVLAGTKQQALMREFLLQAPIARIHLLMSFYQEQTDI